MDLFFRTVAVMTWAPSVVQQALFQTLAGDSTLAGLLGAATEVQRLVLSATPASGSVKLVYAAGTTAPIGGSADMSSGLQTALQALIGFGSATVALTGANQYDITFTGFIGAVSLPTLTANSLVDGSANPISVTPSEITQGVKKIFDFVPDNNPFPYLTLQIRPWKDRGNHDYNGFDSRFIINTWSQPIANVRGDGPVQAIQNRIDQLIHNADISIVGWFPVVLRREFVDIIMDPDNVTRHGIQRFKLFLGEAVES